MAPTTSSRRGRRPPRPLDATAATVRCLTVWAVPRSRSSPDGSRRVGDLDRRPRVRPSPLMSATGSESATSGEVVDRCRCARCARIGVPAAMSRTYTSSTVVRRPRARATSSSRNATRFPSSLIATPRRADRPARSAPRRSTCTSAPVRRSLRYTCAWPSRPPGTSSWRSNERDVPPVARHRPRSSAPSAGGAGRRSSSHVDRGVTHPARDERQPDAAHRDPRSRRPGAASPHLPAAGHGRQHRSRRPRRLSPGGGGRGS